MNATAPSPTATNLIVALLCVIWGSTWIVIKEGLADLPPFTSAGVRFVLAAVAMACITPWLHRREGGDAPPRWLWMTVGICNFAISYGIVYTTERVLPSALVSVLWAVFPLMMAVSGHHFLGEKLTPRHWFGFGIGFVGVVTLFATDLTELGPEAIPMALVLFVSPFVSVIGQTCMKRYGTHTSSAILNRNAMTLGAVLLVAAALLFEREEEAHWTTSAIVGIVYLALPCTVATFSLLYWLLRYAKATRLSVIAYVTPVIALGLGALAGEPLTMATIGGAALVVVGVALVSRS